jgi:hypothetical protein
MIDYEVHEAHGPEYDSFWAKGVELYRGYPLYQKRLKGRRIPIMVLTPSKV